MRVRGLLIPLALSLSLHALLVVIFAVRNIPETPMITSQSDLVVTLNLPKPAERKLPIEAPLETADSPVGADMVKETPRPTDGKRPMDRDAAVAPRSEPLRQSRERPVARKPLDLSLPSVRAHTPSESRGNSETRSEAAIFDPELMERLQLLRSQNTRRGKVPIPGVDVERSDSSFSAGRWETTLRVGNQCFWVIEANPLEPLSNEQWYAVACQ